MSEKPPLHWDLLQRDPNSNFDNQGAVLLLQSKDAEIERLREKNNQLREKNERLRQVVESLDAGDSAWKLMRAALRREDKT